MIRYFCDKCGKQIDGPTDQVLQRTEYGEGKSLHIAVFASNQKVGMYSQGITQRVLDQTYGHFCLHCIIDAVNTLDDRPKPEESCVIDMTRRGGQRLKDKPKAKKG